MLPEIMFLDANHSQSGPIIHFSVGGGRIPIFFAEELLPYINYSDMKLVGSRLKFVGHNHERVIEALYKGSDSHVYGRFLWTNLSPI
jgi:hypothetical protein